MAIPTAIGRYLILRSLGEGGMGSVYLARDPSIDRLVAIKLILAGSHEDRQALRERFEREARAVGQLRHRNIITIFDFGEHDGEPFIAMEYVEGRTLEVLLRSVPPPSLPRNLAVVEEVCAGLHHAHGMGIV